MLEQRRLHAHYPNLIVADDVGMGQCWDNACAIWIDSRFPLFATYPL